MLHNNIYMPRQKRKALHCLSGLPAHEVINTVPNVPALRRRVRAVSSLNVRGKINSRCRGLACHLKGEYIIDTCKKIERVTTMILNAVISMVTGMV